MKKRIVIDISEEEHRRIKEEAASRGISVKKMMLQALLVYTQKFSK